MDPSDKDPRDGEPGEPETTPGSDWGTLDDESLLLDEDFIQRILDGDDGVEVPEEFLIEDTEAFQRAVAEMLAEHGDSEAEEESLAESLAEPLDEPQEAVVQEPEEPEKLSLYKRIKTMPVGQKIKLALLGGREARNLLMRDSNKVIKRLVLRNVKMTEDEICIVVRNRSEETESLDYIASRKDWMKNYQVRLGMATNPKTPVSLAMRLVNTLLDRDLRQLAKSKNVPGVVCSAAKRTLYKRQGK